MKCRIFKDGTRVILSFEQIEDVEAFVERVVQIASNNAEETVSAEEVPDVLPPVESADGEDLMKEPEVEEETAQDVVPALPVRMEFDAPYEGKTPGEIAKEKRFEGHFFLCEAFREGTIPARYQNETVSTIATFLDTYKVLEPPFGNLERMRKYCNVVARVTGDPVLSADSLPDEQVEEAALAAASAAQAFRQALC